MRAFPVAPVCGMLALLLLAATAGTARAEEARLRAVGTRFELSLPDGRVLGSGDLAGAEFELPAADPDRPQRIRFTRVWPSEETPRVWLHDFERLDASSGTWVPLCDADAKGRRAGFPVAGRMDAAGRFVADPERLFLTCTSGAQGKCVLWGYDPAKAAPDGTPLAPLYGACLRMVRADYCGDDRPHTRDGTVIDLYDRVGLMAPEKGAADGFAFEAGWTSAGAVCVARVRRPDLGSRADQLARCPALAEVAPCTPDSAAAAGAVLFNGSRVAP